jgi:hypothetical protein
MQAAAALRQIKSRYRGLAPLMDERMRRQWAATEAQTYGRGGVSAVSGATGMSRNTIRKGLVELAARKRNPRQPVAARIRKQGGGRKRLTETDPGMAQALDRLIEPTTRGDLDFAQKSGHQRLRFLRSQMEVSDAKDSEAAVHG